MEYVTALAVVAVIVGVAAIGALIAAWRRYH